MRKSILFVLMVMVLFVVSVMPVAANHAPGEGMSMPQCRNHDTLRMFWYTNNTDLASWELTRWSRSFVESKFEYEDEEGNKYEYNYDMPTGPWTEVKVFTSGWTQSGKYWDFDDTHQLQLEQTGVHPYKKYKYRLIGFNGGGTKIVKMALTFWQPSYGCHK